MTTVTLVYYGSNEARAADVRVLGLKRTTKSNLADTL